MKGAVSPAFLEDPHLTALGVRHGFGLRGSPEPRGLVRPVQVHGRDVVRIEPGADVAAAPAFGEADAIVSARPGVPVGIVTADCVPLLLAGAGGVAAVHAGWRGLAAGVIGAAVAALGEVRAAAVGPHIGPHCYEVDAAVLEPMRATFGAHVDAALRPGRAGHAWLDLGALAREALAVAGVHAARVSSATAACTHCDAARFDSVRRDGASAGRLVHWIVA